MQLVSFVLNTQAAAAAGGAKRGPIHRTNISMALSAAKSSNNLVASTNVHVHGCGEVRDSLLTS